MIAFATKLHEWVRSNLGRMLKYEVLEEDVVALETLIAAEAAPDRDDGIPQQEKNATVAAWDMIESLELWANEQKLQLGGFDGIESDPKIGESLKRRSDQLEAALAPAVGGMIATVWDFPNLSPEHIARTLGWKLPRVSDDERPAADVDRVNAEFEKSRENHKLATKVTINERFRVNLTHRYPAVVEAWAKRAPRPVRLRKPKDPAKTRDDLIAIIHEAAKSNGTARWVANWSKGVFSVDDVIAEAIEEGVRLADMPVTLVRKGVAPDDDAERRGESRMLELLAIPFDGSRPVGDLVRELKAEHGLRPAEIEKVFLLNRQPIGIGEIATHLNAQPAATKPAKQKQTV